MVEPNTLLAHVLAQTRQNVQLLVSHGQISESDGEHILAKLGSATKHADESSVASLTDRTQRLSMSPAPPKVEARAIWGWTSEDPNDLSFEAGDVVQVIAETNTDWWTGRNRSGKQGLFPSNYVERLPPRSVSPIFVPEPRKSTAPVHSTGDQRYASPALPHPLPQPYPAAPQTHTIGYLPPAGPPPGAAQYSYAPPADPPMQQPVPQAPAKKSKFGGLGQSMMNSAANGLGFGAGAAVGNDIIHSIF